MVGVFASKVRLEKAILPLRIPKPALLFFNRRNVIGNICYSKLNIFSSVIYIYTTLHVVFVRFSTNANVLRSERGWGDLSVAGVTISLVFVITGVL